MEPRFTTSRGPQPQAPESPFAQEIDTQLVSVILRLQELYDAGKRVFAIVTHRDPDSDAVAGCLGLERLIRGVLPPGITVRWMHDGTLSSALKAACGRDTESITNLPGLLDEEGERASIVVVDQPTLHSGAVLPRRMMRASPLANREGDVIIDHHGERRIGHGIVNEPTAGSTAALVYRLLQLAHNHERYRQSHVYEEENARLAMLLNVGARTDAGLAVVGELPVHASEYVRWVVGGTAKQFTTSDALHLDVLGTQRDRLLEELLHRARVYRGVPFEGTIMHLVVSYVGFVESPHCVGACASSLMELAQLREEIGLPIATIVCGTIPGAQQHSEGIVHAGETVHVSIRTEDPISAEHLARALSLHGGGRPGAASVKLHVPKKLDNTSDEVFMSRLFGMIGHRIVDASRLEP